MRGNVKDVVEPATRMKQDGIFASMDRIAIRVVLAPFDLLEKKSVVEWLAMTTKQRVAICRYCGREFKYYPQRSRGIFCSSLCYRLWTKRENHGKRAQTDADNE